MGDYQQDQSELRVYVKHTGDFLEKNTSHRAASNVFYRAKNIEKLRLVGSFAEGRKPAV